MNRRKRPEYSDLAKRKGAEGESHEQRIRRWWFNPGDWVQVQFRASYGLYGKRIIVLCASSSDKRMIRQNF